MTQGLLEKTTNFFLSNIYTNFPSSAFLPLFQTTVIHHFPQIKPFPPTLFPSSSTSFSSSSQNQQTTTTTIPEPLFNQYAPAITALLSTSTSHDTANGTETQEKHRQEEEWKMIQLKRIQDSLNGSKELEDFQVEGSNGEFGGV